MHRVTHKWLCSPIKCSNNNITSNITVEVPLEDNNTSSNIRVGLLETEVKHSLEIVKRIYQILISEEGDMVDNMRVADLVLTLVSVKIPELKVECIYDQHIRPNFQN